MVAPLPSQLDSPKGTASNTILSHPFLRTTQAHIDHKHNAITLNKIGAMLTMVDHTSVNS
jgi:hypothetical protein